ncbi:type II inositol 1,4,5-trisphosphate 5-phosphatase-like [Tubulanus polymorphus]|uniref:type II inositol 1,4,5-trisphosphate 5-phosphatase-like n=1 Tax=Tubulanus polymorphus TaxID=672921 RepID=UPI003DA3E484
MEIFARYIVKERERDYTYRKSLRIYCGTWNVNDQSPPQALHAWIVCDVEPPDVYAIGLQEMDLSKEAFLYNISSQREAQWIDKLSMSLHPDAKYEMVHYERLVGIMLMVFVQEKHMPFVKEVFTKSVATGMMNKMGNKGGVALSLKLYNSSICFVTSHLAAHLEEYERRNQDFHQIYDRMIFIGSELYTIESHEFIFWFGDLNYRIDGINIDVIKECIAKKNDLDLIYLFDQLRTEMRKGNVFKRFEEGKPTFNPTFKYDPGTDNWDSSEKNRKPAWCDRILWCGSHIKQLEYRSHPILRISDHKPVSALFDVQVSVIDDNAYKSVMIEVINELEREKKENQPKLTIKVDPNELHFENVKFMEPQLKRITITNNGKYPVQSRFIEKLDGAISLPWLKVYTQDLCLQPGQEISIDVEVFVNIDYAGMLSSGDNVLEDILVLQVVSMPDLFISVTGGYTNSCFGSPLESRQPMKLEYRPEITSSSTDNARKGICFEVPLEIWRLVDHIYRNGLEEEGLFQEGLLLWNLQTIRETLDAGDTEEFCESVHTIAETLLILLDALPEPVIPSNFYQRCLDSCNDEELAKEVVYNLPPVHRSVFHYLCSFLRELLKNQESNKLDTEFLTWIFGNIILKCPFAKTKLVPKSDGVVRRVQDDSFNESERVEEFMKHFLLENTDGDAVPVVLKEESKPAEKMKSDDTKMIKRKKLKNWFKKKSNPNSSQTILKSSMIGISLIVNLDAAVENEEIWKDFRGNYSNFVVKKLEV